MNGRDARVRAEAVRFYGHPVTEMEMLEFHTLRDAIADDALRVVVNAYGTTPRHTVAADGRNCRDDCIPCGIVRLAQHFPDNGIAVRVARQLRRDP